MPYRCCAPNCLSGCGRKLPKNVHMFSIKRSDWTLYERAIPREGLKINSATRICSLHFHPECISWTSSDSNLRRTKEPRRKPRLVGGSIPTVFPNCPKYLSSGPTPSRSVTTSAEARWSHSIPKPEVEVLEMLEKNEKLESLEDISKMRWKSCSFRHESDRFLIFLHNLEETRILGSLIINSDFNFTVKLFGFSIDSSEFHHLLINRKKLTYKTELDNCIALLRNMSTEDSSPYKKASRLLEEVRSDDILIAFMKEQLILKEVSPTKRRFSPKLFSFAYFWRSASTHCYKILQQLFMLPSITTLNRLSKNVPSTAHDSYLKLRCQHLKEMERTCILMIDEVYTAEKLEISASGQIVGLTDDNEAAKTVLVFMVKSLAHDFSEVIKLVPCRNLTASVLKSHFDDVMMVLSKYVFVQAVSVDNHIINRKLYEMLRSEDSTCSHGHKIKHPFNEGDFLFLMFDVTHGLKNVFNNFHVRQVFKYPDTNGVIKKASFNDLNEIYKLESSRPLRAAHKLTAESLNPSSASKVSPKHALGKSTVFMNLFIGVTVCFPCRCMYDL